MVASVKSAMSEIKSAISSTNLYASGVNLISGLVNGINAKKSAAVSAARSVANAVNAEFTMTLRQARIAKNNYDNPQTPTRAETDMSSSNAAPGADELQIGAQVVQEWAAQEGVLQRLYKIRR